jgi:hypothetical protein
MLSARTSGAPVTRPTSQMKSEDGNLIEGRGIFLGKEDTVGRICWRCRRRFHTDLEVEL